jgi:hypothetical protein
MKLTYTLFEIIKIKTDHTKNLTETDPKTGTGKKPKGSGRRLYTDENPNDTVHVKFRTVQDIKDTLSKTSFKSKSHARQSQIINLIHQRVRAAHNNAKDPDVKSRLKNTLTYIEKRKEASKRKTKQLSETVYDYKEGRDDAPHRLDFDTQKLMDSGVIIICKGMEGDPKSPNYKKHLKNGSPNLITLYNIKKAEKDDKNSWILDAIKHPLEKAPTLYKNASLETYDGKYNQILWSLDKLKIPYENMLKDNPTQDKMEMTERCWKGYTQKGMKTMFGKRYPNCVKAS